MKTQNKKGFTIVELVIVIAVIAILAAVLIPTFAGVIKSANESAALSNARNEYSMYVAYAAQNGEVVTDAYIKVGDYWFELEDSQINKKPVTETLTAGTSYVNMDITAVAKVTLKSGTTPVEGKYFTDAACTSTNAVPATALSADTTAYYKITIEGCNDDVEIYAKVAG